MNNTEALHNSNITGWFSLEYLQNFKHLKCVASELNLTKQRQQSHHHVSLCLSPLHYE